VEARALRERLDVRSAQAEAATIASSLGLTRATGVISALDVGLVRNTVFDNSAGTAAVKQGFSIDVPLPLFDWGQARNAKAQGLYLQSAAKVRDVAVQARSEAREAYTGWRSAYALARHSRDTVVPLRQRINDELVLRYSGMLASVWELLADTRQNILAVDSAIAAQRDFWLADTDLQTALTGTSPGGLARLSANNSNRASPQGH
jgi:outer membrane protein, multidrug efflux system